MIYQGLGYGVGIVTDVVLVVITVFADLVGQDFAAIFQVNGVRLGTNRGENRPYNEDEDMCVYLGVF